MDGHALSGAVADDPNRPVCQRDNRHRFAERWHRPVVHGQLAPLAAPLARVQAGVSGGVRPVGVLGTEAGINPARANGVWCVGRDHGPSHGWHGDPPPPSWLVCPSMEFNLTPVPACQAQPTNLRSRLKRFFLISAGVLALFLAALGVVLPGMPTTPFVLLAAGCFAKASPTLHQWLLNQPRLDTMVRDWETHRSLPLRVKRLACGLMLVMVVVSAWQLAHLPLAAVSVLLLGVLGGWVIWWRIPTR